MTKTTVSSETILGTNYKVISLTSNKYNPKIDQDIILTCEVNDVYGDPIGEEEVELLKNGTSFATGETNNSGIATFIVNCNEWGIVNYSVGNVNCQVNVDGWRTLVNGGTYKISRNKNMAKLELSSWVGSGGASSWTQMGGSSSFLAEDVRPANIVNGLISDGRVVFYISASTGGIFHKSMTSAGYSSLAMNMSLMWSIRDEDL